MLLSLYASFRWARWAVDKDYVLKMSVFTVVVSLVSAFFGTGIGSFLLGPLPVLSFPFYGVWDETMGPPLPPEGYGFWMQTYQIRFLTQPFYSIRPITYSAYSVNLLTIEIGSLSGSFIPPNSLYSFIIPAVIFMLINLLGALLGLGLSKLVKIQETRWERISSLVPILLGIGIIGAGFLLSKLSVVETVRNPPWGGNYVSVTLYPYQMDAFVFLVFGITWLAIKVIEIIASRNI